MVMGAGGLVWLGTGHGGRGAPTPVQITAAVPGQPPTPAPNLTALPPAAGLPTRVVVQSAGIDVPVAEVGVVFQDGRPVWETAWHAAGHNMDSALPGEPGNMVLTGHVSVADRGNLAAFRALDRVKAGDVVEVYSGARVFRYAVTEISVVDAYATRVLASDHRSRMTLITCTKDLKHRLVVNGTLLS
jgi:sortase A